MKYDYQQWQFVSYINEICRLRQIYEKKDRLNREFVENEIALKSKEFDSKIKDANEYEESDLIDDYQDYVNILMGDYYNELAAMFQRMYAIFENQVALESHFDLTKYPKIFEVKNAVNVLKHREGRSYNALKAAHSKFIEPSKQFENITSGCSSIVLNIEFQDLLEFCDEAVKAWQDRLNEYNKGLETISTDI